MSRIPRAPRPTDRPDPARATSARPAKPRSPPRPRNGSSRKPTTDSSASPAPDGKVIYLSGAPTDGGFDPAADSPAAAFIRNRIFPADQLARRRNSAGRLPAVPVRRATRIISLNSAALLDPVESMLNHLLLQLVTGLPLAIGIVTAGGYLLVRRALRRSNTSPAPPSASPSTI